LSFVVVVLALFVAVSTKVIVAPTIAAGVLSVTVPARVPPDVVWPRTLIGLLMQISKAKRNPATTPRRKILNMMDVLHEVIALP
jgi:hypothetical protein